MFLSVEPTIRPARRGGAMTYFSVKELPQTAMLPGIARRAAWLNGVMLTFFTFEPHSIVPEHSHPHEQITLVTRGALQFSFAGETRVLCPGDGVCIPGNAVHSAIVLDEPTEAIDAWNPPREDYKA
jgi:mannose-6-phosphate isomerase-like protein (cupin superfamily)